MNWVQMETWSPYVVGAAMGVLSWLVFLLSDTYLSSSAAYSRLSGMLERLIRGKPVAEKEYSTKTPPLIDWQFMFVIGIVLGAFLASILSGSFRFEMSPVLWSEHIGNTSLIRFFVSFIGGVLVGIGSCWVNGCLIEHGISGTLQMAVSSWLVVVCLFLSGIFTALILY